MFYEEIIDCLLNKKINRRNNNLIIIGDESNKLLWDIPNTSNVYFYDFHVDTASAINIKIDLSKINVKDVLTYTLNYLKNNNIIYGLSNYSLPLNNQFDIYKFKGILSSFFVTIQLIFYNTECLTEEDQMLLNELYYFYNNPFFNVVSLTKNDFNTYSLTKNRVLDNKKNYQKIELIKPYKLKHNIKE